eukprot:TRINITY_DN6637_c0_g1_i7.p2 TRINITY_DN6637_c0_g1~~TRINITY_DN6637_c0_g1_i7.p2  ORF type:complete len:185 (-),score=9.41 TRINITY_DN6637_c0_g1_i7:130-684(-)
MFLKSNYRQLLRRFRSSYRPIITQFTHHPYDELADLYPSNDIQIGITSWGPDVTCAKDVTSRLPGIYTNIANYVDWIDNTLQAANNELELGEGLQFLAFDYLLESATVSFDFQEEVQEGLLGLVISETCLNGTTDEVCSETGIYTNGYYYDQTLNQCLESNNSCLNQFQSIEDCNEKCLVELLG